jgi:hypothetical protein
MGFLIFLWIFMGLWTGFAIAFIEGKVNHRPARYKRALLWTLLAGPVGFCWLILKSCLDYAGGMRADQRAVADAARAQLARDRDVSH